MTAGPRTPYNAGPPIAYTDELRSRIQGNLAGHARYEAALDDRKHAAVAIVLVDSDEGEDRVDPYRFENMRMEDIPGGAQGLDGRMVDVSGGTAFLLCRRAAGLRGHASQWALPGGRIDAGETPEEAAFASSTRSSGFGWHPKRSLAGWTITRLGRGT